jgi:hypothetical protein
MRYPEDGGLTAEQRARREKVRLEAAELIDARRRRPGDCPAVPAPLEYSIEWLT